MPSGFAFDRAGMPFGIARLKVDARGFAVPWFVDRRADRPDGEPDFRVMDPRRQKLAIKERRCWVCGLPIREKFFAFVVGPMCGVNRVSSEPPCHLACARWSARACPFLSHPKRIRDETNMPPNPSMAGVGIPRNPGVALLWICRAYKTFHHNGVLFDLGDPVAVEWIAEGREATRAEVMQSVVDGLPALRNMALMDGPDAIAELDGQIARFYREHLPKEPTP